MKNKNQHRLHFYGTLVLFIFVSFGVLLIKQLSPYAALEDCYSKNGSEQLTCIEDEVTNILRHKSTSVIIDEISYSNPASVVARECHSITHVLGVTLFRSLNNTEEALRQCTPGCNAGCSHGVLAASFLNVGDRDQNSGSMFDHVETKDPQFIIDTYCTSLNGCHGAGHLLALKTKDVATSLSWCDRASQAQFKDSCFKGVFMESIGGQDSFSFLSSDDERDIIFPDCRAIGTQYRAACFQYLPLTTTYLLPLTTNVSSVEQATIIKLCNSLPSDERAQCYQGIGNAYSQVVGLCRIFPVQEDRIACSRGTAERILHFDANPTSWFSYCASISEPLRKSDCYKIVFTYASSHPLFTSSTKEALCAYATLNQECLDESKR